MWTRSGVFSFSGSVRIFEHRVTYASAGDICFSSFVAIFEQSNTVKSLEVLKICHWSWTCQLGLQFEVLQLSADIWAQSNICFCRWYLFPDFVTCSFLFHEAFGILIRKVLKICRWPVHWWRLWFGLSCVWSRVFEFCLSAEIREMRFLFPLFISHVVLEVLYMLFSRACTYYLFWFIL